MNWHFAHFDDVAPRDMHDFYQARIAVFVLEQNCPFQDVDGADPHCWHLIGRESAQGELVAYSRLVAPGVKYPEPSIGRILTTAKARGTGLGRELVAESISRAEKLWPGLSIKIGAQQRLQRFYESYGFAQTSEPYVEDGIMHIEMTR